jgi:probable rRNA maturation factor
VTRGAGLEVQVSTGSFDVPADLLESAARLTLTEEGHGSAEISVTLLDDEQIRRLNAEYLGKDVPTDVLAFALGDEKAPLGDVYVGVEQARRQADELGVPVTEELVRMVVHGTLHALGYDHPEGRERERSPMFARQEELVRQVLETRGG